mgnify:CR=1 FL=1
MRTYRALPQQDSHTAIGYMIVVQIAAGVVLAVWGLSSAAPAAVTGVVAAIVIGGVVVFRKVVGMMVFTIMRKAPAMTQHRPS